MLILANDWATREKTLHSYELWARHVAPQFQGSLESITYSNRWARDNQKTLVEKGMAGVVKAIGDYAEKKAARRQTAGKTSLGPKR